jgi:hypothetical protein
MLGRSKQSREKGKLPATGGRKADGSGSPDGRVAERDEKGIVPSHPSFADFPPKRD